MPDGASGAKVVNPIHVREGEVVDIHWHLRTGKVWIERRNCPPPATTDVRAAGSAPGLDAETKA